jgi:DNA-binding NarL/FixJ family response regulator
MTSAIRVLVVDDHAGVRAALAALVDATSGMSVVGEAADGSAAVARATALRPDVVLMDVNMPVMSGFEAARLLAERQPGVRVLLISAHVHAEVVRTARELGVMGLLPKCGSADAVIRAIQDASAGRYTWPDLAENQT